MKTSNVLAMVRKFIDPLKQWVSIFSPVETVFLCKGALAMIASLLIAIPLSALSGNSRTQTFQLVQGWNAIFLAVEPSENLPEVLFADTPVDIVAGFDEVISTRQFSSNPTTDMLRQLGWGTWYAPTREDAFLSNLGAVHGNKGYLVHATAATTLSVAGEVTVNTISWKPNAYNLVGFTLDALAPPTFDQFFNGSSAHQGQAVYRLTDGAWRRVSAPASTSMKNGEAFWIFCNSSSTYQGPLSVRTSTSQGVVLQADLDNLILENQTTHPLQPTLEYAGSGTDGVPMSIVISVMGEEQQSLSSVSVSLGDGDWSQLLPPLEAGASIRVPFALRSEAMTVAEAKTVLCIKSDLGTETWVPVTGVREDLK